MVHVLVLPVFTVALQFVNVAEGGLQDDQDREEADKANDCGECVDSGEVGPGFHEVFVTELSIAPFSRKGKGG